MVRSWMVWGRVVWGWVMGSWVGIWCWCIRFWGVWSGWSICRLWMIRGWRWGIAIGWWGWSVCRLWMIRGWRWGIAIGWWGWSVTVWGWGMSGISVSTSFSIDIYCRNYARNYHPTLHDVSNITIYYNLKNYLLSSFLSKGK